MFGYGKILEIDLSKKKIKKSEIKKNYAKKWLGGNGFGAIELYKRIKKVDAFSPNNPLIFASAALSGLVPIASCTGVFSRSPLTGFLGESYFRGDFAPEMKFAGWDVIIITGKLSKPGYIYIENDNVEIRKCDFWGRDSWECEDALKKELGDVEVACIGQAGENLVRFSCITHEYGRQAGRTGLGAVMGSKKLKALAISGSKGLRPAKPIELLKLNGEIIKLSLGESTEKYRIYGTSGGVLKLNKAGALPTKNWNKSTFEFAEKISGQELKQDWKTEEGCFYCPIACGKLTSFGKIKEEGPEYETIYALGSNCYVKDLKTIAEANELCDRFGIDTITTGNIIALAFELSEKKLIKEKLKWGSGDDIIKLIKLIVKKKGLGKYMAEGIVPFAKKYKGLKYAVQVKGLEPGGFHASGLPAYALSIAVDVRGADHQRAGAYGIDLASEETRYQIKEKGKLVKKAEDYYTLFDSLGFCKFIRHFMTVELMAKCFTLVTGIETNEKNLMKAGERIYNVEKLINIKLGWKEKHDNLPWKILNQPLPDGPAKGKKINKGDFEKMKKEYYKARGWDEKGIPKKSTLKRLGL